MALDKITRVRGQGLSDPLLLDGNISARDGTFSGILTATTFIGSVVGAASTSGFASTSFNLAGTPDIIVGTINATDITATSLSGLGGNITALNASQLTTGTIPDTRFPVTLPSISGANLTNLNANQLASGTIPDARFPSVLPAVSGVNLTNLDASYLASGTVPDGRFPGTLPTISGANLTNLNATNITSGTLSGNRFPSVLPAVSGANLTNLDASNLSSGTLPDARFPATLPAVSGANLTNLTAGNLTGTISNDRLPNPVVKNLTGNVTGNVTGDLTGDVTGNVSGTAGGLSGTPDITVGAITGSSASFSGNVDIGGVLTYEDVTNVDAIGLVTARSGVNITGGDLAVSNNAVISGILTVGSSSITINGDGNEVKVGTGLTLSHTNGVYVGQVNLHSTGLELGTGNLQSHNINSSGIITATSFVKSSGTSSQFLKADGSVDTNTYLTSYSETDPIVGAVNGIVKSNGSGTISAATAGTDYLTPSGDGTDLTFNYQQAPHGSTVNISVTVASKTSAHRYQSQGSSLGYVLEGIQAPFLTLTPGRTYRFNLSSSNQSSHPFRFYLEADRTTQYSTNVTTASTYTEITVTDTTPTVLHYQCSLHGYMGNAIYCNSNAVYTPETITGLDGANITGTVTATTFSGSGSSLTSLNASQLSSGTVPDARFPSTLPTVSGANLTNLNASQLSSGTIPDARFPSTLPTVSGANLTNLDASDLASGTIPDARFPSVLPAIDGSQLTGIAAQGAAGYWEKTSAGINTITNVGIGITMPATDTLLHLNKTDSTQATIRFTNSSTGSTQGDGAIIGVNASEELKISHLEQKDIILATDNTTRMKVKSDGKIGIGTNFDPTYTLDVQGDINFTGTLLQNGTAFQSGGGGGGSPLTVKELSAQGGSTNVTVSNVTELQFNNGSGFNVTDEGSGVAFVDLGSTFNPWYVSGSEPLAASGEEPVEIIAGPGIAITTTPVASVGIGTTLSKALTISQDGNAINGIGTAVPFTDAEFYYSGSLLIDTTTTVDVPSGSSNIAYVRHTEIEVADGADLIIADGDELIPDILDIASPAIIEPLHNPNTVTVEKKINVQNNGTLVSSTIDTINFNTDLNVSVAGNTATVNSTASGGGGGGGGGVSEALAIAYAIAL
jgi:hypothetical protein